MTLRMHVERKKAQEEMRRLMAERKKKDIKSVQIENPLAKYNNAGQLMCLLCSSIVRSENVWQVHVNSKQHRENVENAKKLKQLTNNFTVRKLKHKNQSPAKDAPPEKKIKGILKNSTKSSDVVQKPKNTAPQIVSHHDEEIKRAPLNSATKLSTNDGEQSTSDVSQESKDQATSDVPIPEGFFDDPILDAKVNISPLNSE